MSDKLISILPLVWRSHPVRHFLVMSMVLIAPLIAWLVFVVPGWL
jgi:hypothetical protein